MDLAFLRENGLIVFLVFFYVDYLQKSPNHSPLCIHSFLFCDHEAPPLQKEEKGRCGMFVLSIVAGTPTFTRSTWHTQLLSKYLLSRRKRKGGKKENRLLFVRLV